MVDDPINRHEFEAVVKDHERRLAGHDGLYSDLRDTREELVRFTEALQAARHEITCGSTDRDLCKQDCSGYRSNFERRIKALEQFRWQFGGAVIIVAAVPAWAVFIMKWVG